MNAPWRQELSPIDLLERAGTVWAQRPAVTEGDVSYTWAEFRARARRLASALRRSGLERGDRIAFCALNSEALLLAHFAVPLAGGVLVAVNTRLLASEVATIVAHSGARWVFFSPELEGQLAELPPSLPRIRLGGPFEEFLAQGSEEPLERWLQDENEACAIDYTSGTTGQPKGVVYHHRGALLNAVAVTLENRLRPDSAMLWTLPMFHCNGWSHTWAMAASGCRSVCIPRPDAEPVWRLLESEGITHLNAAPTVLIALVNHPAAHRLPRRVRVCTGGAPPSPTLIAQMEALNFDLAHLYGLTETYGPFSINVPPPQAAEWPAEVLAAYRARQGVPHILAGEVRVVDRDMGDVPADGVAMGEVVMRGNTLMKGYFRDPEATEEAFRGGWFHSGDLGVMHPDGSIELRDRAKDIVISGGENISTIEVEQAVMSHPAVLEAAVVAIPDERWGERPKAFVTLRPGHTATAEEIIEHVRSRLAHFKAPSAVEFGELPKTSTGKIQKYVLREREWTGLERRIH